MCYDVGRVRFMCYGDEDVVLLSIINNLCVLVIVKSCFAINSKKLMCSGHNKVVLIS